MSNTELVQMQGQDQGNQMSRWQGLAMAITVPILYPLL